MRLKAIGVFLRGITAEESLTAVDGSTDVAHLRLECDYTLVLADTLAPAVLTLAFLGAMRHAVSLAIFVALTFTASVAITGSEHVAASGVPTGESRLTCLIAFICLEKLIKLEYFLYPSIFLVFRVQLLFLLRSLLSEEVEVSFGMQLGHKSNFFAFPSFQLVLIQLCRIVPSLVGSGDRTGSQFLCSGLSKSLLGSLRCTPFVKSKAWPTLSRIHFLF